jgi:hypothetical protein
MLHTVAWSKDLGRTPVDTPVMPYAECLNQAQRTGRYPGSPTVAPGPRSEPLPGQSADRENHSPDPPQCRRCAGNCEAMCGISGLLDRLEAFGDAVVARIDDLAVAIDRLASRQRLRPDDHRDRPLHGIDAVVEGARPRSGARRGRVAQARRSPPDMKGAPEPASSANQHPAQRDS